MEEAEAKDWLEQQQRVSRETIERLQVLTRLVFDENRRQNLVSRGTLDAMWSRHIVDSAQLLRFAPSPGCSWLDLGTGAGFPGLVVAIAHEGPVTLVEERRKRADFLVRAAAELGISHKVELIWAKAERIEPRPFDVISARAFAPLNRLLAISHSFSTAKTRWILPKGRSAQSEVDAALASWQGEFRLEPSLTDEDARIIVAEGVAPRKNGRGSGGGRR